MKIIISFIFSLVFFKLFLFWLWLWQLKEYHLGRFLAHFEGQVFKKIISAFWRKRFPKFTLKIIAISFAGFSSEIFLIFLIFSKPDREFYFFLLFLLFLAPIFSSFLFAIFQIPTIIWRGRILRKAKQKRQSLENLLVIGITGSYGKTSTKEFLATILSAKFNVLKTKEHQNSEVGIARCILNDLKPEHQIFICEMGAYNRGGIKLLCDIVKPKIGILTGINEQHMATFGSQENIIKTKYELIEGLPEDGIAFFNAKNKYCLELYQRTLLRQGYGGQAKIKKILYGENIKLAGLENIEGAKAVARELGMNEEEIEKVCQKIENRASEGSEGEDEGKALIAYKFAGIKIKKARLPARQGIMELNIIDATYSANPDSVISHLEYLTLRFPQGKKVIVMPCLIELGKASKEVHRRIGQKIAEVCDLAIITTKDRFKEIKEGSASSPQGGRKAEILFIENAKAIFEKIKGFCQPGDIILLESRVPNEVIKLLVIK